MCLRGAMRLWTKLLETHQLEPSGKADFMGEPPGKRKWIFEVTPGLTPGREPEMNGLMETKDGWTDQREEEGSVVVF